jgi:hypothetical protein
LNNRIKFQIGGILLGIERPKVMVDNKGFYLNSNASKKGCNVKFTTLAVAVNEERQINATWLSHLYPVRGGESAITCPCCRTV